MRWRRRRLSGNLTGTGEILLMRNFSYSSIIGTKNGMYEGLVIFQILMVLGCFFFIILMSRQRESVLSKLMLCIGFFGAIQNAGYLLEMLSRDIGEAMIAVRVEFMGGVYISTFLFIFLYKKIINYLKSDFLAFRFSSLCSLIRRLTFTYPRTKT